MKDRSRHFPGANRGRCVNKFGVPHHRYTLLLANGEEIVMDVGYEEDWGDVQQCWPEDCDNLTEAVGWGNDADGHVEIVRVVDEESGKALDVHQWARNCVWCYVENYSSP